jgi:tetratricopeptide (TPR) repeat protein
MFIEQSSAIRQLRGSRAVLLVLAGTVALLLLALVLGGPTAAAATAERLQIDELTTQVDDMQKILNLVLVPIAVLIGILCAGGVIGVVFSVRDQRRVSQLHELTVSSEMASQRRTDQSYNTFLEASQRTLTLVNDTLQLAKQATDAAAHTMQLKADTNLAAIEAKAEDLILNVIETSDFEKVVDDPDNRSRLQALANELTSLEGYLMLQDIELPPYSRFVKGIDQYLEDDTAGALHTLRHAAQDTANRQLQRFSLYWTAKLNNALGQYDHALRLFEQAVEHVGADTVERYELDRAHLETEFFQIADSSEATEPLTRLREVRRTLVKLEVVAGKLWEKTKDERRQNANHEVAATRGDIYTWIAYDRVHLNRQLLDVVRIEALRALARDDGTFDGTLSLVAGDAPVTKGEEPSEAAQKLARVLELEPEALRAWALMQAEGVYARQTHVGGADIDFSLEFGRAECHFALHRAEDVAEYKKLEGKAIQDQRGSHREHRWTVELAQIALICEARLLWHARDDRDGAEVEHHTIDIEGAYTRVQDALHGAPDHRVKIFSHLQRRCLTEDEFLVEAGLLRQQALSPPEADDGDDDAPLASAA